MSTAPALIVGTAGWTIPRGQAAAFPGDGTHLERYAGRLGGVEINSSFHRPHRPATYARWAACVPPGFRFAVKLPRAITHERRLVECGAALERFLEEAGALGDRLGPLLVQLPPSLAFDAGIAAAFFEDLRRRVGGDVACEPRHATWFAGAADALLVRYRVARVAADPAPVPDAAVPGGWRELGYWRLHGSPRMYYSGYEAGVIEAMAAVLSTPDAGVLRRWCLFDNTASGAAAGDALGLLGRLRRRGVAG